MMRRRHKLVKLGQIMLEVAILIELDDASTPSPRSTLSTAVPAVAILIELDDASTQVETNGATVWPSGRNPY